MINGQKKNAQQAKYKILSGSNNTDIEMKLFSFCPASPFYLMNDWVTFWPA